MGDLTAEDGEPLLSGGISAINNWPNPIYIGGDDKTCPVCHSDTMTAPVQIQCGHVICNPCMQSIMAFDSQQSRCPICRECIFEYKSLRSGRIRRPRDKTVPYGQLAPYHRDEVRHYEPNHGRVEPDIERQNEAIDTIGTRSETSQILDQPSEPQASRASNVQIEDRVHSQISQPIDLSIRTYSDSAVNTDQVESQPVIVYESVVIHDADQTQPPRNVIELDSQLSSTSAQRDSVLLGANPATITYEVLRCIKDHRGRGPHIRYLVAYEDGSESWEPLSHMIRCPNELTTYRRRLHVKNQQSYRLRRAREQRNPSGGR